MVGWWEDGGGGEDFGLDKYFSSFLFIFPQSETSSCQMEAVGRVWEALDKLSVDNPEEYKHVSAHL